FGHGAPRRDRGQSPLTSAAAMSPCEVPAPPRFRAFPHLSPRDATGDSPPSRLGEPWPSGTAGDEGGRLAEDEAARRGGARLVELDRREGLEEAADGDAGLEAGEVHPEADMRAGGEREVQAGVR